LEAAATTTIVALLPETDHHFEFVKTLKNGAGGKRLELFERGRKKRSV
jgi:hypothetical protein